MPPQEFYIYKHCGAFLSFNPPTLAQIWEAQAEQRLIAAQAAALRLPPDSPPELVEAAAMNDKGELIAAEDLKRAHDAIIAQY